MQFNCCTRSLALKSELKKTVNAQEIGVRFSKTNGPAGFAFASHQNIYETINENNTCDIENTL